MKLKFKKESEKTDPQVIQATENIDPVRKEVADMIEAEYRAERERIDSAKRAVKKKKALKAAIISLISLVVVLGIVFLVFKVLIPNSKYNKALDLYYDGQYQEAITAFEALDGYKDSAQQIENCKTAIKDEAYLAAKQLYTQGKYEEAIAAFEKLSGYKDSEKQIQNCKNAITESAYEEAKQLYADGKFSEAMAAFEALDGYKDSAEQIKNCKNNLKDEDYEAAKKLYADGKLQDAVAAFKALDGYKDSLEIIEKIYQEPDFYKFAAAGDPLFFGSYEQDNNLEEGPESIEWVILAREGTKVLLISKNALDARAFNDSYADVTWEKCSLRTWLNDTFIKSAFTEEEQAFIISSNVSADKNPDNDTDPGNATEDKVFLLSIAEAGKYFASDELRKCNPTAYAAANGSPEKSESASSGKAACHWWLRTPGTKLDLAASVNSGGAVSSAGHNVSSSNVYVRPALWVDLGE